MEPVVLGNLRPRVDGGQLAGKLHTGNKETSSEVAGLLAEALRVARPRALYKTAYVSEHGKDSVVIDGITYNSHVLRVNLDNVYKVFPYIVTSGAELEAWAHAHQDPFTRYVADTISEMIMQEAVTYLKSLLAEQNAASNISTMNPGSLADWPLTEQAKLFRLLGDPEAAIGVKLTPSFLMTPIKSVSGLAFLSDTGFQNCQLCPREDCPGRKARYDPDLYRTRYRGPDS